MIAFADPIFTEDCPAVKQYTNMLTELGNTSMGRYVRAFRAALLNNTLSEHAGKYIIMRKGEIMFDAIYDSEEELFSSGCFGTYFHIPCD